jgi:hypothetical protein
MRKVSPKVEAAVNAEIATRIKTHHKGKKLKHQSPDRWSPNAAIVNCYNGGAESVGWHSDQLTYLGPSPSASLENSGFAASFPKRPSPKGNPKTHPTPRAKSPSTYRTTRCS